MLYEISLMKVLSPYQPPYMTQQERINGLTLMIKGLSMTYRRTYVILHLQILRSAIELCAGEVSIIPKIEFL